MTEETETAQTKTQETEQTEETEQAELNNGTGNRRNHTTEGQGETDSSRRRHRQTAETEKSLRLKSPAGTNRSAERKTRRQIQHRQTFPVIWL